MGIGPNRQVFGKEKGDDPGDEDPCGKGLGNIGEQFTIGVSQPCGQALANGKGVSAGCFLTCPAGRCAAASTAPGFCNEGAGRRLFS